MSSITGPSLAPVDSSTGEVAEVGAVDWSTTTTGSARHRVSRMGVVTAVGSTQVRETVEVELGSHCCEVRATVDQSELESSGGVGEGSGSGLDYGIRRKA